MIGKRLAHYTILSEIGSGGMGVVYRARDEHLHCDVALKVLPKDLLNTETARKRFQREAYALANSPHQNIVTVHNFDAQDGVDFLVMEFLDGPCLSDVLVAGGLTEEQTLNFGGQIALGLVAAHEAGVIHRDIKPSNMKITKSGVLKILDFGLAKTPEPLDSEATTWVTEAGHVVGTVPYMAPEILLGGQATKQSDIWAAGIVLYQMATGRRPHQSTSRASLVEEIVSGTVSSPKRWNSRVSKGLEALILKATHRDPAARYPSAADLHAEIKRVQESRQKNKHVFLVRALIATVGILAAAFAGYWLIDHYPKRAYSASLAVLPLRNLSTDSSQVFFADGMTEELINTLAQVGELRVISRTSVMAFRGDDRPLKEVARKLAVRWIVEGSVTKDGPHVRVNAQLLDASKDQSVWAQRYERELSDVLALQAELARAITDGVHVAIAPHEASRMRRWRRVVPEAHEAYLRGLYRWNQREPEDVQVALQEYTRSMQLDPQYASPHAGLAEIYSFMGNYSLIPQDMAYGSARAEATKALDLDPDLAEAHSSLGVIKVEYEWDWPGAEKEYRRALELNPGSAATRQAYADFLSRQGRHQEALATIKAALNLDPLSPPINGMLGTVLFYSRHYEEAIAQYKATLDLRPEQVLTRYYLGLAYLATRRYSDAISEFQKTVQQSGGVPLARAGLACAYGMAGKKAEALRIMEQLTALSQTAVVSPSLFALICVGLGDSEQALHYLEEGYRVRDSYLGHLKVLPTVDSLRGEPRFQEIMRQMKLEGPTV